MEEMNENELAYLAGIIDGEGCIGLKHNGRGGYKLYLEVKSTCRELLCRIQGRTRLGRPPKPITDLRKCDGGGVRSTYSRWRVFGRDVVRVLENTRRWLIVKRTQAEIAIAYRNLPLEDRRRGGSECYQRLQECNGRRTRLRQNGLLDPLSETAESTE